MVARLIAPILILAACVAAGAAARAEQATPAPAMTTTGQSTGTDLCQAFTRDSDESWTPNREVILTSADGRNTVMVNSQQVFTRGVYYSGLDVAAMLDEACIPAK